MPNVQYYQRQSPLIKMNKIKVVLFILVSIASHHLFAQKSIDTLLLRLHDICKNENIPGAMISIVKSDSLIFAGGIGFANIEKQERATENHLFRLGSISKSFTALGIVKLVDQGKIKISSPIDSIDSTLNIKNKWDVKSPITIEQILEHTAGFDDMHGHANYPKKGLENLTCERMVKAHKKSLYARWKPGVRSAYSNPGYVLAGYLIEKVTKIPYDEYLKNEIISPLGMNNSGFYFKDNPQMFIATGYQSEGGKLFPLEFTSVQGGAASDFCSNAKEMAFFLRYMLTKKTATTGQEIINPDWFDRIENPKTTIAAKNGFVGGYGLGNMSIWTNNNLFHGHDGGIDGFSSIYLYSREADFGLAVSINKQGNIFGIIDEILDYYLGKNNYLNTEVKPISEATKDQFTGFYNFKSPRNQTMYFAQKMMSGHSIDFKEDMLFVKGFNDVILDTLYHLDNNQYYRKNEGIPFVMLLKNEEGTPVLWLGGEYAERGNKTIQITKNYLVLGAVIMSIQYFFIGFIWWVIQFFKKVKKPKMSRFSLWSSSAFLMFTIAAFLFTTELYERSDSFNIGSVAVFLGSILFFASSLISFVRSFKLPEEGIIFIWYYRITAFALFSLALFLLSNNFIGFRLWAY